MPTGGEREYCQAVLSQAIEVPIAHTTPVRVTTVPETDTPILKATIDQARNMACHTSLILRHPPLRSLSLPYQRTRLGWKPTATIRGPP